MKLSVCVLSLAFALILSSFNHPKEPASTSTATGIYGVASRGSLPYTLELSLNADHTFHYVNNSVPEKAIDVTGTWEQHGDKVKLRDYSTKFAINDTWKIDGCGCLKSRKGLEFTRLCNLSAENH